jgi:hypothetical protein
MMSFNQPDIQILGSIENGLADSDPKLASMLNIFSRLAAGEEMPAYETIRVRRGPASGLRPGRARRYPRRIAVFPDARWMDTRLGWPQAMFLLWAVISAALLAVVLLLSTSGSKACIRSMGTACPSPSIPQHADPSHLMGLRLSTEAFPRGQSAGCAVVQLHPQAHMIGNTCARANGGSARRSADYLP